MKKRLEIEFSFIKYSKSNYSTENQYERKAWDCWCCWYFAIIIKDAPNGTIIAIPNDMNGIRTINTDSWIKITVGI